MKAKARKIKFRKIETRKTKIDSNVPKTKIGHYINQITFFRLLVISVFFITAFGIRIYRITEPPLDFHPTRQYHSALIARGYYFEHLPSTPQWQKDIAIKNRQLVGLIEPPILEHLAFWGYRILGGEYLWFPRAMSTVFWLIGGVFLFLLAKKISSTLDAALFSTAFYLFLPYGISASRSFQPDPMMVMALIISLYTIWQYFAQPSKLRLIVAAAISACALFIKPMSVFIIFGAFIPLAIYCFGIRRALFNKNTLIFVTIVFLPSVIYYGYGLLIAGFLKKSTQSILLQWLLLTSKFWRGWLAQIEKALGLVPFIAGLLGIFMFCKGKAKVMIIGLWIGYLVYATMFPYATHTHNYYQLPYIPIVALCLTPIADLVVTRLNQTCTKLAWRIPVFAVMVLSIFLVLYHVKKQLFHPHFENHIKISKEIGELVHHNSKTIALASPHAYSLMYNGELSGVSWPCAGNFMVNAYQKGQSQITINLKEVFESLWKKHEPEYFIITNFKEFAKQAPLRRFLDERFTILAKNKNYLIYDLKKAKMPSSKK
jgi:hypothetical protein